MQKRQKYLLFLKIPATNAGGKKVSSMKPWKKFRRDNRAAMGIGTLIIFIAVVLVAAVAAGVLIQTSGFLQQKAASTGRVSTEQVASGIMVTSVVGNITSVPGGAVNALAIYVEPNAGSSDIDLNTAVLSLSNETIEVQMRYNSSKFTSQSGYGNIFDGSLSAWNNLGATEFGLIVLQDEDSSISATAPTINKGDKVIITVNVNSAFSNIEERTKITGQIRPEFGAPGIIEFTTPPAYTRSVVTLQ